MARILRDTQENGTHSPDNSAYPTKKLPEGSFEINGGAGGIEAASKKHTSNNLRAQVSCFISAVPPRSTTLKSSPASLFLRCTPKHRATPAP